MCTAWSIQFTLSNRWYGAGCTAAVVELQFNAALNPGAESTASVPVYSAVVEFIRKQDWIDGKLLSTVITVCQLHPLLIFAQ